MAFKEVVDDLFNQMDLDGNQEVNINEFIDYYHQEYTALQEEIEDLELRVRDQEQRSWQIEARLEEMRRIEKLSQYSHPVFP